MDKEQGLLVVNVLPKESYNDCHIIGSINVPLDTLKEYSHGLKRETPIVVYCASYVCSASRSAWHTLNEMGFSNVWAYEGGMAQWCQLGYPVEGSCAQEYFKIEHHKAEESHLQKINAQDLKKKMGL